MQSSVPARPLSSRTLITGAAGFTGRYLVELLTKEGHEVHAVIHGKLSESVANVAAVHEADLADLAAITRVVDEV
jgi:uncharacterized protein YbjT (DUF2867 family)